MTAVAATFEPVSFSDVPGWNSDRHAAAFDTFVRSSRAVCEAKAPSNPASAIRHEQLAAVCGKALLMAGDGALTDAQAKAFFESHFTPHRVLHNGDAGLLTGYYEPEIEGSLVRTGRFDIPVYRRPPELANIVSEAERGTVGVALTHGRRTASGGLEAFETREQIELGSLAGRGLELVWLADAVDCFFMHIQGSGLIRLPDGSGLRITYDGKNGHPYTSVGRVLIDAGHFAPGEMSLASLKDWLAADAERGRRAMWQNKSFVFFRPLTAAEGDAALGVMHVPLTPGRSLAVDTSVHVIGTPVYVVAPELTHAAADGSGFAQLMIAQDVGSAIRGPERGDIYFGSGHDAGALAGITKHPGRFIALLPNAFATT